MQYTCIALQYACLVTHDNTIRSPSYTGQQVTSKQELEHVWEIGANQENESFSLPAFPPTETRCRNDEDGLCLCSRI